MRILYDGFIYQIQSAGGINRYFANLISRLPESFSPVLIADHVREVNYPDHPNLQIYRLGKMRFPNVSYRLSTRWAKVEDALRTRMLARRADVFHPTYYELVTGQSMRSDHGSVVITVHDMINELLPEFTDPTGSAAHTKRKAIEAADAIVCVSENTKTDLLRWYAVPEERLTVIHEASELNAEMSYGIEPVPSRPYYLYVGSRARYKNFEGLLRAFAKAVEVIRDLALCVVGVDFTDPEKRLLSDLKLRERVEHYGHPPDSHLAKLYRCSLGLVYPSLYEGFGIPPLEAMSCGTVAIVSNVSSLPEVVGDAAILFDPHSEEELVAILRSLPGDTALRQDLIQRGARRARSFSWESTAAKTVQIYESLA